MSSVDASTSTSNTAMDAGSLMIEQNEYFEFDAYDSLQCLMQLSCATSNIHIQPFIERINIKTIWLSHERHNLLNALSEALLDPLLTLHIARSFRPLLPEIVLRSLSEHVSVGFTLTRHEQLGSALSKLIHIAPHLLGLVLKYYSSSASPFEVLLSSIDGNLERYCDVVRTVYRLISAAPREFVPLWNFSSFFSVLSIDGVDLQTRWYAAQVVATVIGMSDVHRQAFVERYCCSNGLQSYESDNSICNNGSLAVLQAFEHECQAGEMALMLRNKSSNVFEEAGKGLLVYTIEDLCKDVVTDVSGVLITSMRGGKFGLDNLVNTGIVPENGKIPRLIATETTRRNMRSLAMALVSQAPVLLEGETGSGKTALVDELAALTGQPNVLRIHLGDQTDSKVLLGTYVCTDVPGAFAWVPGPLTRAVTEGYWLMIEDIELAPLDVVSMLLPLLESRELFVPGRGEVISAAPGFQLFATQTVRSGGVSNTAMGHSSLLSSLWTRVMVEPLGLIELELVVSRLFPELAPHASSLILCVFDLARDLARDHEGSQGRGVTVRDLLKWCSRLVERISAAVSSDEGDVVREDMLAEAVDCFCGFVNSVQERRAMIAAIGEALGVPVNRVELFLDLHKPDIIRGQNHLTIGRARLGVTIGCSSGTKRTFAHTRHSSLLMERVAACIHRNEPILLSGETGTGKTSVVQHLANSVGTELVVMNLSQQSDSSDLLGGFRPVDVRVLASPLKDMFDNVFGKCFGRKANATFLREMQLSFGRQKWRRMGKLMRNAITMAKKRMNRDFEASQQDTSGDDHVASMNENRKKGSSVASMSPELRDMWHQFADSVSTFERQVEQVEQGFAFSFVEGALINAIRKGNWVLLDEINLASPETLESLNGLLNSATGSVVLAERGDTAPIPRHTNFRLLACMNPAGDVGKRSLPPALRNRFTEFFVDEMTQRDDLITIVQAYLAPLGSAIVPVINTIVEFFLSARIAAETRLSDGTSHRPHYSLRTLSRGLAYARDVTPMFGFRRALFEGISMAFLTQLDVTSFKLMEAMIRHYLVADIPDHVLTKPPQCPGPSFVQIDRFWVEAGSTDPTGLTLPSAGTFDNDVVSGNSSEQDGDSKYIITRSVAENLRRIARVVAAGSHPVLLQGPTSCGKTSMVEYLARRTGHRFVRINNHEHTDLQEYLGSYVPDQQGRLAFQEGILVEAARNGYWVVLDELNLAPSDVLEALNRLLDDNKELYIPATQEVIRPHPHFMLFATQNPPGLYGGRKALSRAFRNRFVELHFEDIPNDELQVILERRTALPPSYCQRLIHVLKELQQQRRGTRMFAGKHGFITLRDLFRWAARSPGSWQELANEGYILLAERLRREDEKPIVQRALEKHLKVSIDVDALYAPENNPAFIEMLNALHAARQEDSTDNDLKQCGNVVWTPSMRRLFVIVERCLRFQEPILLVGETGTGKTTVCQVLSAFAKKKLHIINCHQNTETADFLGGLRPVRGKDALIPVLRSNILSWLERIIVTSRHNGSIPRIDVQMDSPLEALVAFFQQCVRHFGSSNALAVEMDMNSDIVSNICALCSEYRTLFEWADGPLVTAMKEGNNFLLDEISLADDSVLERINSVLEPDRMLVLAEKGGRDIPEYRAHANFRILATMNPGGDFGKKELSPALRNRFTEIWVPQVSAFSDLHPIIEQSLNEPLRLMAHVLLDFIHWFRKVKTKTVVSLRDITSWVSFMNNTSPLVGSKNSFIHGAYLVFLDALDVPIESTNSFAKGSCSETSFLRNCHKKLSDLADTVLPIDASASVYDKTEPAHITSTGRFVLGSFSIPCGTLPLPVGSVSGSFSLSAPTTASNATRLLRGLQLTKPILLEGSPGVGKTSLVTALARASGHPLVRINLSEQTDIMDLFGSDLPVEGGEKGEFGWRDGAFLQAIKAGHWILLDELNLASQSVLEGLNACLDHRGAIYVPELDRTFSCPHAVRIFACQNPLAQGGGRRGLPKSFLNRFTQVHVSALSFDDLLHILTSSFPSIDASILASMMQFNAAVHKAVMVDCKFGRRGAPFEFNLRDCMRWAELMVYHQSRGRWNPASFFALLYQYRMRTKADRSHLRSLFVRTFGANSLPKFRSFSYRVDSDYIQVGSSVLSRSPAAFATSHSGQLDSLALQPAILEPLEVLMQCVEMRWMSILVGPAASGKTSLVRLLAALTRHDLREFAMNSAVDTMELLGGFEQIEPCRYRKEIIDDSASIVAVVTDACLVNTHDMTPDAAVNAIRPLLDLWAAFNAKAVSVSEKGNGAIFSPGEYTLLRDVLVEADNLVRRHKISLWSTIDSAVSTPPQGSPVALLATLESVKDLTQSAASGRFEWVDGILIQALERGQWLLIDNVNFCSPSVLDRLNPLLEPNGELLVNERGLVNGTVKKVKPHPNFRLFLAMDPAKGDISRAMRNRGIEICMIAPDCNSNNAAHLSASDQDDVDFLIPMKDLRSSAIIAQLNSLGAVGHAVPRAIVDFHSNLIEGVPGLYPYQHAALTARLSVRHILHTAELVAQQLQHGVGVLVALRTSLSEVYVRSTLLAIEQQAILPLIDAHVADLQQHMVGPLAKLDVSGWPITVNIALYQRHGLLATCFKDGFLFFFMARQLRCSNVIEKCSSRNDIDLAMLFSNRSSNINVEVRSLEWLNSWHVAGMHFLENASVLDWRTREALLLSVATACTPSAGVTYKGGPCELAAVIRKLFSSTLGRALSSCASRLASNIGWNARQLQGAIIDLSLNPPLLARLSIAVETTVLNGNGLCNDNSTESIRMLFDYFLSLLRRFQLIRQRLVREQCETMILSVGEALPSDRLSLLQQASRLAAGTLSAASLCHPLGAALGQLFSSIDFALAPIMMATSPIEVDEEFQEVCLQIEAMNAESWHALLKSINTLFEERDALWDLCHCFVDENIQVSRFAVHWRWLVKALRVTAAVLSENTTSDLSLALFSRARDSVTRVDVLMGFSSALAKSSRTLWKHGGHPYTLTVPELSDIHEEFVAINDSLDVHRAVTSRAPGLLLGLPTYHLMFHVSSLLRRSLVEAAATLFFLGELSASDREASPLTESIAKSPASFRAEIAELRARENVITKDNDTSENLSYFEVAPDAKDLVTPGSQHILSLQLWPLVDHSLINSEVVAIISPVASLIAAGISTSEVDTRAHIWTKLRLIATTTTRKILDRAIDAGMATSFAPLSFVALQRFVWCFDKDNDNNDDESWRRLLGLFSDIEVEWLRRVWHNASNDLTLIESCFTTTVISDISNADIVSDDPATCFGNPFGASQAVVSMAMLSSGHDVVALADFSGRVDQLEKFRKHLLSTAESTVASKHASSADWATLWAATVRTLSSFRELLSKTSALSDAVRAVSRVQNIRNGDTVATISSSDDIHVQDALMALAEAIRTVGSEQLLLHEENLVGPLLLKLAAFWDNNRNSNITGTIDASINEIERGEAWILLSLLQIALLVPSNPIDPAAKYKVKSDIVAGKLSEVCIEIRTRAAISQISIGSMDTSELELLRNRRSTLQSELADLKRRVPRRPSSEHAFMEVFGELRRFADSLASSTMVLELASALARGVRYPTSANDIATSLSKESVWQANIDHFLETCTRQFEMFRDVLQPIVVAAYRLRGGMRCLASAARLSVWYKERNLDADRCLRLIVNLAMPSAAANLSDHLRVLMTDFQTAGLLDKAVVMSRRGRVSKKKNSMVASTNQASVSAKSLRAILLQLYEMATRTRKCGMDMNMLATIEAVFGCFVGAWSEAERRTAEREEMKKSLYKYKTRDHTIESEEEEIAREFRALFPTYHDQYSGLNDDDETLDSTSKTTEPTASDTLVDSELPYSELGRDRSRDSPLVMALHEAIFSRLARCLWWHSSTTCDDSIGLPPSALDDCDLLEVRRAGYEAAAVAIDALSNEISAGLGGVIDATLLPSHLLAVSQQTSSLDSMISRIDRLDPSTGADTVSSSLGGEQAKFHDVYRDADIVEARLVQPVLHDLTVRLRELLLEWPGHPNLQRILAIANRVLSFRITAPLLQIVTGLEMLLRQAQAWEDYAAKHVSLRIHLDRVTRLVLRWRALELKCWPYMLQAQQRRHESRASLKWHHLYKLANGTPWSETDNGAWDDDATEEHLSEVFSTLDRWIHSSTLGEFPAVLRILAAFHAQVATANTLMGIYTTECSIKGATSVVDDSIEIQDNNSTDVTSDGTSLSPAARRYRARLCNMLWNLHAHWFQFLSSVLKEVASRRAPIEKELRNFAKIAKWNDMNYYAMKDSADRTHRALHRYIRKWNEVLSTPLLALLAAPITASPTEVVVAANSTMTKTDNYLSRKGKGAASLEELGSAVNDAIVSCLGDLTDTIDASVIEQLSIDDTAVRLFGLGGSNNNLLRNRLPDLARRYSRAIARHGLPAAETAFAAVSVDTLAVTLVSRAAQLSELSHSTREEGKADVRKHAKVLKKRAIDTLLKRLRQYGLSSRIVAAANVNFVDDAPNALRRVFEAPAVNVAVALEKSNIHIGNTLSESEQHALSTCSTLWKEAHSYYVRIVTRIQAIRQSASSPHTDVGLQVSKRAVGFVEHLFHILGTQRRFLAQVIREHADLALFEAIVGDVANSMTASDLLTSSPLEQEENILPTKQATLASSLKQLSAFTDMAAGQLKGSLLTLSFVCSSDDNDVASKSRSALSPDAVQRHLSSRSMLEKALTGILECKEQLDAFEAYRSTEFIGRCVPTLDRTMAPVVHIMPPSAATTACSTRSRLAHILNLLTKVEVLVRPEGLISNDIISLLSQLQDVLLKNELVKSSASIAKDHSYTAEAFANDFSNELTAIIKHILTSMEDIREYKEERVNLKKERTAATTNEDGDDMSEDDYDEEENMCFLTSNRHHVALLRMLRLPEFNCISARLSASIYRITEESNVIDTNVSDTLRVASELLRLLSPLMTRYRLLLSFYLSGMVAFHRSMNKLTYVLANIVSDLLTKGFCTPSADEDEGEEGEEQSGDGIGMASGRGEKNVSDQIENEDQVEGCRGDKEDEEDKDLDDEDCVDMSADFDGELYDKERKPHEPGEDEEPEDDEDPDVDKQMGDLDAEKADVVNERMWGEDEEDKTDETKGNEKTEMDSSMTNQHAESELVGKQDDDNNGQDDNASSNDKKDSRKPDPATDDKEERDNNNNDDSNGCEEDLEGPINDQDDEEFEENHGFELDNKKETGEDGDDNADGDGEDLDLPDDLNLDCGEDGNDGGADNINDGGDADTEGEEMDCDPMEGTNTDEVAPEENDAQKQEPMPMDDTSDENADDQNNEDEENPDHNRDEDSKTENDDVNPSSGRAEHGEEAPEEAEEDDSKNFPNNRSQNENEPPQEQAQPFGVTDDIGQRSEMMDMDASDSTQDQQRGDASQSAQQQSAMSASDDDQSHWERQRERQRRDANEHEQRREDESRKRRERDEANPYRSTGDALKKWQERLNIIEGKQDDEQPAESDGDHDQIYDADAYQHMDVDATDISHDAQALAVAEDMNQVRPLDNNEEKPSEDDDERVDGAADDMPQNSQDDNKKNDDMNNPPASGPKMLSERRGKQQNDDDSSNEPENEIDLENGDIEDDADINVNAFDEQLRLDQVRDEDDIRDDGAGDKEIEDVKLSPEELARLRAEAETALIERSKSEGVPRQDEEANRALWARYDHISSGLAQDLCEQLRLILEPTLATKLKGDYRTGKRLNMKKIIPYIASQFKKDKIWLRRTKPSKRTYQVMICVDDSESMSDNHSVQLAFESLSLTTKALTQLEVGDISVVSFGEDSRLIHPFGSVFDDDAGSRCVGEFSFAAKQTKVARMLEFTLGLLHTARNMGSNSDTLQLQFVISDGLLLDGDQKEACRWIRAAAEQNVLLAFIIVDNPKNKHSVLDVQSYSFVGGQPRITSYMDSFPFPYYVVLRDIETLPEILSDALRQWFELVSNRAT